MTYPSAEEPQRPDDGEAQEAGATADTAATTEKVDPAGLSDAGTVAVLDEPGAAPLSEKPVLEWTTEDWARWIEEPALLVPPDEEPPAGAAEAAPAPLPDLSEEEVDDRIEGDPTATWTLPPDEDDDDAKWWSTVAGLPDPATAPAPPVPLPPPPEVAPVPEAPPPQPPENKPPFLPPPPGSQPPVVTPPPPLASSLPLPVLPPPPPLPTPEAPLPVGVPPVTEPRREPPEAAPRRPQPPRPRPEVAAPSRSPQPHRISLEPVDSVAVRIRAGLSLLGVSVLVGAVSAGLITVAIFMASVVLRRALG